MMKCNAFKLFKHGSLLTLVNVDVLVGAAEWVKDLNAVVRDNSNPNPGKPTFGKTRNAIFGNICNMIKLSVSLDTSVPNA